MFLPQAVTAIAGSLLGARLTRSWGIKRVFLVGLTANLSSMLLLLLSQAVIANQSLAYVILLVATTCLGIGFGLTVPSLNTFVAAFFPTGVERAVLSLNALLGLGTVLAPVFVAIFVGLGAWSAVATAGRCSAGRTVVVLHAFALADRNRRGSAERRPGQTPDPVLGICRVCSPVRHRGDDERQLGHACTWPTTSARRRPSRRWH